MNVNPPGRAALAATMAALLLLPLPGRSAAPAIPGAAGPCVAGWQELPVPDGSFRAVPFEVVTVGGKLGWVLGSTDKGLLSLRWDGRWLRRDDVGPGGRRGLVGGAAMGRDVVLGVGLTRPPVARLDVLAGRVVARRWSADDVPQRAGAQETLADVARRKASRTWAVGVGLAGGRSRAIAVWCSGRTWRRASPVAAGGSGLLAVAHAPSGAVWAAGWSDNAAGTPRPLLVQRTAHGWLSSRGADLPPGRAVLTDLGFRPGLGGWAVGYLVPLGSSSHVPVLERREGKRWTRQPLPWAGDTPAIPRSLSIAEDGSLWIAGAQLATDGREARGFIAHGSGADWQTWVLETPFDVRSEIHSVAATSEGAVAAGTVGSTTVVLRTCGAATAAASGRRIAVGSMRQRRQPRNPHRGTGMAATGSPFTAAGPGQGLRSPVAAESVVIRDVARAKNLFEVVRTYGVTVADVDDDGWQDIVISRHWTAKPRLALGSAEGFRSASGAAFSVIDRHGCDVGDVDADGSKDILCVVGRARGAAVNRHELSLSAADGDATLARAGLGLADPLGRGRAVAFIRLDEDAYPEVFITTQPEREDALPAPNRFFRNDGGRYVPAPGVGLDVPTGGSCAEGVDVDGDGDQDLLHCQTQPADGRPAGLRVYRNDGGRLRERSAALGVQPIGDVDVTMADVTGDGRRDLIQLSRNRLRVSKRTASGFRRIYQARLTWGEAVAAGDVNGDGRADIYVLRSGRKTNLPDWLLISGRRGRAFTSVQVPQTSLGMGDDVAVIDHDRNGLADFVVLNGRDTRAGPVQLLAAYRPGKAP